MAIRLSIKSVLKKRREFKIRIRQQRRDRAFRRRVKKYILDDKAIDDLLHSEPSRNYHVLWRAILYT